MAKKIFDNPAGGPAQEPQPIVDPILTQMAADRKGAPNPQPLFYQRGIKGRDGSGEYIVKDKGAVMMPNGDYAKPGDTFNQAAEGLNDAQMAHLIGSSFVGKNPVREARSDKQPMVTKIEQPKVVKSDAKGGADPANC